jgi:hypothetical protein
MIERAVTENDLISEFYQAHENVAKSWENYAQINNGQIEGIVNSYIMEADLSFLRNKKLVSIHTMRQLTHGSGVASLFLGIPIIQNTKIVIKPMGLNEERWKLKKKGKAKEFIISFFKNCTPFSLDNSYTIISKHSVNTSLIIDKKLWQIIKDVGHLVQIVYHNNILNLAYCDLVSPQSIEILIKEIEDKYSI